MKKVVCLVMVAACLVLSSGCEDSDSGGASPASQIAGTYIGVLSSPTAGVVTTHTIIITAVDSTTIQIAPASGSASSTITATVLSGTTTGDVPAIGIMISDGLPNNGALIPSTGGLSYFYFLGGPDDTNIEAFAGIKQ